MESTDIFQRCFSAHHACANAGSEPDYWDASPDFREAVFQQSPSFEQSTIHAGQRSGVTPLDQPFAVCSTIAKVNPENTSTWLVAKDGSRFPVPASVS